MAEPKSSQFLVMLLLCWYQEGLKTIILWVISFFCQFQKSDKSWHKKVNKRRIVTCRFGNCNLQVYFNYISESFSTCYRRYLHLVHVLVFYLQNKIFCPSIHVECLCVHINFIIGSKEKDVKGIRSRWCW